MDVFKIADNAEIPTYATEGSAAFDLRACLSIGQAVRAYNPLNKQIQIPVKMIGGAVGIQIHPQYRVLIPTGLIFDIPNNNVIKIFPRSGTALKSGLTLANATAIIDCDYIDETFIIVYNISDALVNVFDQDRIAQGIVEPVKQLKIRQTAVQPTQKTSRVGGLGSTGTS